MDQNASYFARGDRLPFRNTIHSERENKIPFYWISLFVTIAVVLALVVIVVIIVNWSFPPAYSEVSASIPNKLDVVPLKEYQFVCPNNEIITKLTDNKVQCSGGKEEQLLMTTYNSQTFENSSGFGGVEVYSLNGETFFIEPLTKKSSYQNPCPHSHCSPVVVLCPNGDVLTGLKYATYKKQVVSLSLICR